MSRDSWNQLYWHYPQFARCSKSFNKPCKWLLIKSLSFASICNFGVDAPSRTSNGSIIHLNHYLVHCERLIRAVNDARARYSKKLIHIIIVWSSNCECTKLQIIKTIANLARWHCFKLSDMLTARRDIAICLSITVLFYSVVRVASPWQKTLTARWYE